MREGVISQSSVEFLWSRSTKKNVGEPFFAVFQKISGSRKRLWIGRGENIKFFSEKILSHGAEMFRRGILWYFTNFRYPKMLGINREKVRHDRDSNPEPTA